MLILWKGKTDEKIKSGGIYTPKGLYQNFEINHLNEEIRHSKCYFSHPGSCTHLDLLHIANAMSMMRKNVNIPHFKLLKIFHQTVPLKGVFLLTA